MAHYEITSQQILTFPFFLRKRNRFPFFQRKQVEQFEQRGNQGGKGGLSPDGVRHGGQTNLYTGAPFKSGARSCVILPPSWKRFDAALASRGGGVGVSVTIRSVSIKRSFHGYNTQGVYSLWRHSDVGCFKRIAVFSSNSTDSIRACIELEKKKEEWKEKEGLERGEDAWVVSCFVPVTLNLVAGNNSRSGSRTGARRDRINVIARGKSGVNRWPSFLSSSREERFAGKEVQLIDDSWYPPSLGLTRIPSQVFFF